MKQRLRKKISLVGMTTLPMMLIACGSGGDTAVSSSTTCASYQYQEDAQANYHRDLDGDGDGIACESLPSRASGSTPVPVPSPAPVPNPAPGPAPQPVPAPVPPPSDQADPNVAYPVATFFEQLQTRGAQYTLSGQFNNGGARTDQRHEFERTALGPSPWPWQGRIDLQRNLISVNRYENSTLSSSDTYALYFERAGQFVGEQASGQVGYLINPSQTVRPLSARIGQSGVIGQHSVFTQIDSKTMPDEPPVQTGHRQINWTMGTDDQGRPKYCESTTESANTGATVGAFEWCYGMTAAGEPTGYLSYAYTYGANSGQLAGDNLRWGAPSPNGNNPIDGQSWQSEPNAVEQQVVMDCRSFVSSGRFDGRRQFAFERESGQLNFDAEAVTLSNFVWDAQRDQYVASAVGLTDAGSSYENYATLDRAGNPNYYRTKRLSANGSYPTIHECYDGVLYRPELVSVGAITTLSCTLSNQRDGVVEVTEQTFGVQDGYLYRNDVQSFDLFSGVTSSSPISSDSRTVALLDDGWYQFSRRWGYKGGGFGWDSAEFDVNGTVRSYSSSFNNLFSSLSCRPGG